MGFGVWGLGFGVWGLGFIVYGLVFHHAPVVADVEQAQAGQLFHARDAVQPPRGGVGGLMGETGCNVRGGGFMGKTG